MSALDRWLCGLTRHRPAMRQAEHGRLFLRCECGWTSSGVQVTRPAGPRRIIPLRWLRQAEHQQRRLA